MDAEDLVVDDHAERQKIEHVGKVVPNVGVAVFSGAFCIEAVRLGHASRFMIPSYQMDAVGVSQFQTHKKRNRLNAEHASIDVIACLGLPVSICSWVSGLDGS